MLHRSGGACARPPLWISLRGGRSADKRWCGTPHPVARPYDRAGPSSGRELPAHDAGRRAFRRFTTAISLSPEPPSGNGRSRSLVSLIPQGFRPAFIRSTSPYGRPHVVGAGGDPRPPGSPADEAEPAGAASLPVRMRLMRTPSVGWDALQKLMVRNKSGTNNKILGRQIPLS